MEETWLKKIVRRTFFPHDAIRRIGFGPLAGKIYRVSDVTGMSPWYSGVERQQQKAFASIVQAGDTVFDVGANWGLHTLYFSSLVGKSRRAVAIEPFARAFEELEWHINLNHCSNVTVYRGALSNRCGQGSFVAGNSASTGHLGGGEPDVDDRSQVRMLTLDAVVGEQKVRQLRLVKIDVEGAESAVLNGATKTLIDLRPWLIGELHTPQQDVKVAELLIGHNYGISRVSGPPIKKISVGCPDRNGVWGTIIARPN